LNVTASAEALAGINRMKMAMMRIGKMQFMDQPPDGKVFQGDNE
jgi:hypothetical protein